MKIEHTALQVEDPQAMARWYVEHLGMVICRESGPPNYAFFMTDSAGQSMLEIYYNPSAGLPDYRGMNPLELHIAFASDNVPAAVARLMEAGATLKGEVATTDSGDTLAMLRDPWGVAVQLVHRAEPMY